MTRLFDLGNLPTSGIISKATSHKGLRGGLPGELARNESTVSFSRFVPPLLSKVIVGQLNVFDEAILYISGA